MLLITGDYHTGNIGEEALTRPGGTFMKPGVKCYLNNTTLPFNL